VFHRSEKPLAALVLMIGLAACGAATDESGSVSNWEHTSSTAGNVTTFANTAGSRWGADATLVEELSIGQLEGEDAYSFGMISSIWPTDDRVFVADARLNVVRAYDLQGNYLATIGTTGQGPGEYERAAGVIGLGDGRVAIHDAQKLILYDADGNYVETWGSAENTGFRFMGPGMYAVSSDGRIFLRKMIIPEGGLRRGGIGNLRFEMREALPDGLGEGIAFPSFDYEAPVAEVAMGDNMVAMPVPFAPELQAAMMPDGGFVAGIPDDYSFEIHRPNGSVVVVSKYWSPVPVNDGEVMLQMRGQRIVINGRQVRIDTSGMDIPATKPAYTGLLPTRDGRIVVLPAAEITVAEECLDPNLTGDDLSIMDCSSGTRHADVFESDGSFLGSFEVPDGVSFGWGAYIDGDEIWASMQDEYGTVMVKRYRLVRPRDPAES
jgi:hypothetical protein